MCRNVRLKSLLRISPAGRAGGGRQKAGETASLFPLLIAILFHLFSVTGISFFFVFITYWTTLTVVHRGKVFCAP
jgi:hypothetical protein